MESQDVHATVIHIDENSTPEELVAVYKVLADKSLDALNTLVSLEEQIIAIGLDPTSVREAGILIGSMLYASRKCELLANEVVNFINSLPTTETVN